MVKLRIYDGKLIEIFVDFVQSMYDWDYTINGKFFTRNPDGYLESEWAAVQTAFNHARQRIESGELDLKSLTEKRTASFQNSSEL